MGVPQYTTPTFVLTFNDQTLDLTTATGVYVTFQSSGGGIVTKTGDDITVTATTISIYFEQYETATMGEGTVRIQVNWIDVNGNRCASDIVSVQITEQLLKKVIT